MKVEEFKTKWTLKEDNLNSISAKTLSGLGLSEKTIGFLINSGLPDEAAPFLSFSKDSEDIYEGVQKLNNVYGFLESEFEKYIVIGSLGDGDPIVVNTALNDQIEYLDHEDYFSAQLFNSDIYGLAKCLLAYRNFVDKIIEENGEDAFFDSDFTDRQFENLRAELYNADPIALGNNGFWSAQLQMDLDLREDNKNEKS